MLLPSLALRSLACCALLAATTGCASFKTLLGRFDSIAGIEAEGQPVELKYQQNVQAWAASLDEPETQIHRSVRENPSGSARSRLVQIKDRALRTLSLIHISEPTRPY